MTNDKATYTITFADTVPTTMPDRIENCADPDVLTVETSTDGDTLTVTVYGDSNAIPVFEEAMRDEELDAYPSATVTCDVNAGAGVEKAPQ